METTFVHLFFNVYNSFPARPAVCGDGDWPQIRAVIIIHGLRGIVKSSPQNVKEPCFHTVLFVEFWFALLGTNRYRGKISGDGGYSISPNDTVRRRLVALGQHITMRIVGILHRTAVCRDWAGYSWYHAPVLYFSGIFSSKGESNPSFSSCLNHS